MTYQFMSQSHKEENLISGGPNKNEGGRQLENNLKENKRGGRLSATRE